jgi:ATP-dependent helicase/nuclease subunit A
VLSAIEDPNDPLALAGALRSPFFALSDNGLYLLADGRHGDLADSLSQCDQVDALSPLDRERALRARRLLGEWRGLKDHLPIAALVDRVLDESGFEAALLGEFLGDRKRANARKLVRLARRFDARGGFTLAHFVAQLREDLRKPPREDEAATTDEAGESIRLMSIHQAKGLEFPIVVVPDLNRKSDHGRAGVAFHEDLGPLVRLGKASAGLDPDEVDSTDALGWKTYQILEKVQEDEESRRLFYVATTRARDVLILSAGNGPEAKPVSIAMQLLDKRFDRTTGFCRHILPEGWGAPSVRVTTMSPLSRSVGPRERRPQPDLLAVANVITSATLEAPKARSASRRPPPRFVDLLEAPDRSPRAIRVQQLVRAILDDPLALALALELELEPLKFIEAARRAGRRLEPPAASELVLDAVRLLDPWLSGPLGQELAKASKIERGYDWTLNWPPGSDHSTVFQGRAEFVACDPSGVRSVFVFSTPGTLESLERLRLLLSARVVERETQEKVAHCRRVVLGDEGAMVEESDVSEDVIEKILTVTDFGASVSRDGRERYGMPSHPEGVAEDSPGHRPGNRFKAQESSP